MSYTVQNGDTVASVAAAMNLYAHDVAAANGLAVDAELEPGQQLRLPEEAERPSPPDSTPQERTDDALDAFLAAQSQADGSPGAQGNLDQARRNLDAAVAAELGPHVNGVPRNIPGAPSGQEMIASFRSTLLERQAGNADAQAALNQSVNAFQTEYRGDVLAQTDVYGSSVTPQDRLEALATTLAGEPPEVVAEVLRQPSVQRRIDAAADWVAEPYAGLSTEEASYDAQAATEASQRLASVTEGMPPAFAAAVLERSMPTVEKIAGVEAQASGSQPFENLSRAVGALGDDPQAAALTRDVAEAYGPQVERWSGFFIDPNAGIVRHAVGNGADPALTIELAAQLEASGKADEAGALLRSAANGVGDLQHALQDKVEAYGEHTEELNWLIANAGPNMTAEQLQQAIDGYIAGKGEDWQAELRELQQGIVADARAFTQATGALADLPPGLADAAPDVRDTLAGFAGDEATQDGLSFALSLDPSILAGEDGSSATALFADLGQKGSDFLKNLGNAYVTGNIMPAVGTLNPLDPASVSRANAAIDDLQRNGARLFGIPQHEIDAGTRQLRGLVDTLSDPGSRLSTDAALRNIQGLDDVKRDLQALKDTTFSNHFAGTAFRTLALGMSGAALLTSAQTTIDNPSAQNIIGTLSYSVGLAQDAGAFAATMRLVDADSRVGSWGLGASAAGRFTAKFVGVLNAAYFAAGAVDQFNQGSAPGFIFNAAGAGGALLATFGQAAGLGSWAGPVGVGVMIVATAGVALVTHRQDVDAKTDAAEAFYRHAGIDGDAIAALGNEAAEQAGQLRDGLDLTPGQVQAIAAGHPDIFASPGHAQAALDVLAANGIDGEHALAFLDAARADDANYAERFFVQFSAKPAGQEASYEQGLRAFVANELPGAAAVAREQSPELFGEAAGQREQAARDYEGLTSRDPGNIGNLFKSNDDPAYQAELVRILEDNGTLDFYVEQSATNYAYNGWPEAARGAIEAARDAGVLDDGEARDYLAQLPG